LVPVLLVGLTAMTTTAAGHTTSGTQPRSHADGRILFTHCQARGCHVYTANPDGSAVMRVTPAGDAEQGDWSPDGRHIVYVGFASGDAAIWIVDTDGRHARQLTPDDPGSDNFWPRYSANGAWILFTNCGGDDCDGGISAIRPDGTGMHHITPNSHLSYNYADQSPDGRRMAYMRWHVGGVKMAVYVSSADGSQQRRITPPRLEAWVPDWAPDGSRIAFSSYVFFDRPAPQLYTVRPDGAGLETLTHPPYPHADVRPAYSPDSRKVVFESDRRYGDRCCADLYMVGAQGGPVHRVSLPFDAYEPRWGTAPIIPSTSARVPTTSSGSNGGPPCARLPQPTVAAPCAPSAGNRPQVPRG
jgi:Tol biopolymer transport system component